MKWHSCRISDFTEKEYECAYRQLSPSRKAHVDRFRQPDDRRRSLAGEILAQKLLRQWGISDAVLETRENGQPVLSGCRLFVSISHCDDFVACALNDTPIGIDAERIQPRSPALAKRVCVPEELEYLQNAASDEERLVRFYEIWTAKEAWFKKLGTGIQNLQSVNTLTLPRQVFRMEDYLVTILYE